MKSTIEKSSHPSGQAVLARVALYSTVYGPSDAVKNACDASNNVDGFTSLDRVFPATQSGNVMLLRPRSVLTPKQLSAVFHGRMKAVGTETYAMGKSKKRQQLEANKATNGADYKATDGDLKQAPKKIKARRKKSSSKAETVLA